MWTEEQLNRRESQSGDPPADTERHTDRVVKQNVRDCQEKVFGGASLIRGRWELNYMVEKWTVFSSFLFNTTEAAAAAEEFQNNLIIRSETKDSGSGEGADRGES